MMEDKLSATEKDMLKVIKAGLDESESLSLSDEISALDSNIRKTENLLRFFGKGDDTVNVPERKNDMPAPAIVIRPFSELLKEANEKNQDEIAFLDIFTREEIAENRKYIRALNEEFNAVHRLDEVDIMIAAIAGILGGAIDCVFGGFVKSANGQNIPGSMSRFVRELFNKVLPPDRIKKLEDISKVPYDALNYDNKGNVIVEEIVDGLSPIFHHEVSLGHDPILGFIFGVLDSLRGTVTTIGFDGKFFIQAAEGFSERKAKNLFQAVATVFLHMLSDVNGTSGAKNGGMGLPVPFMALFNKLQFGAVGDNDSIAELVKSMYYQGYDFRHFCCMSIPVMITEAIVRISYFAKRLYEGNSFSDSIPIGNNHIKKPKLGTMLFIAHSAATAINAGKVALTENPLNINYSQWLSFAKYSIKQLKWIMVDKSQLRDKYVKNIIDGEWDILYGDIVALWQEMAKDTNVVYKI